MLRQNHGLRAVAASRAWLYSELVWVGMAEIGWSGTEVVIVDCLIFSAINERAVLSGVDRGRLLFRGGQARRILRPSSVRKSGWSLKTLILNSDLKTNYRWRLHKRTEILVFNIDLLPVNEVSSHCLIVY